MSRLIPKSNHSPEQFSLRFRMLMAYHNLTLEKIAEHTSNAISTVGTWKNGRLPNSRATLEKIAHLFQVTPDYLLKGILQEGDTSTSVAKIQEISAQIINYNNSMRYMMPMPGMYYNPQMPMQMPMQPMQMPQGMMHHQPMPMQMPHTPVMRAPIEGLRTQEVNGAMMPDNFTPQA